MIEQMKTGYVSAQQFLLGIFIRRGIQMKSFISRGDRQQIRSCVPIHAHALAQSIVAVTVEFLHNGNPMFTYIYTEICLDVLFE